MAPFTYMKADIGEYQRKSSQTLTLGVNGSLVSHKSLGVFATCKNGICTCIGYMKIDTQVDYLADLKNQPVGSLCVTHILPFCGYFKGQEQIGFNPTSWHLVTYNFL